MSRLLPGWRSLLRFWLSILTIAAAGMTTLQCLGPLPKHSAQLQVPPGSRQFAKPAEAGIPASASAAVPSTKEPPSGEQSPPPVRPPAGPKKAGDIAQENVGRGTIDQVSKPSRSRVLVILHPPRSEGGRAAAQQLATRAELASDEIATEAVTNAPPRATIRLYSLKDHALARRLGRELAQLGYPWQIENLSDRQPSAGQQTLEVWLPER